MIVAGIAPALIGDMADVTGRRVVYLLTMGIYCVANVGIAVQSSWAALFVLRMVQSAGSAATIAIGYGVVADIAGPAERGGFVGTLLLGPNVATAIGPVLGGVLVQQPGWRWIFWFLAIASAVCFFSMMIYLPETCRFIVGNGLVPVSGIHRTLLSRVTSLCRSGKERLDAEKAMTAQTNLPKKKPFKFPNPLASLKMLLRKDTVLITLIYGLYYTNFSCLQASLSTLFIDIYEVTELQAGLTYLPFGLGSVIGAYCSGILMNRDYRITARDYNIVIDNIAGDDLSTFPIEEARFRSIWYSISATGVCTMGYGWTLHTKTVRQILFVAKENGCIELPVV
ncbi:hypothetical protein NX059_003272 [Plenodomus lindquistii]|nr:hypothetical protein NX059_003272 [Plenodomus lindquistii]